MLAAATAFSYGCYRAAHPSHRPDAQGNAAPIKEVASEAHAREIVLEPYNSVDHVYRNAKSQIPTSVRLAILDTADWDAIWHRIVGSSSTTYDGAKSMPRTASAVYPAASDSAPLPPVDFSREMLLVVGMGQAPCMGYQINVDTVFRDKDKRIYAVVRERHHGSRCGCLNEVVSPVDIVRVPRSIRPVTFLERAETNVCEERDQTGVVR